METYPSWFFFPARARPPDWVATFIQAVKAAQPEIGSADVEALTSDKVLSALRPELLLLGYEVEAGKKAGEMGAERVAYEVDAVHDDLGIVVEVEAGRGARGNAIYRDLIRTSLIVGARFLVLGVMQEYRHNQGGKVVKVQSYRDARDQLDAIYASGRLQLPFEGVLLFGY